jgi:hypothetical protein
MRFSGGKALAYTAAICSTCSTFVSAITLDLSSDGILPPELSPPLDQTNGWIPTR